MASEVELESLNQTVADFDSISRWTGVALCLCFKRALFRRRVNQRETLVRQKTLLYGHSLALNCQWSV